MTWASSVGMNQVTKNAPFGTENTPVVEIKIVGGRRIEIPARLNTEVNKRYILSSHVAYIICIILYIQCMRF